MGTLFYVLSVFVAWCCGSLRVPQRFFPRNPIVIALEAEKKRVEADLVAAMMGRPAASAAATSPPPATK